MSKRPTSTTHGLGVIAEPIPRAAVLTAWWNAWSARACSADELIDAMTLFGPQVVIDHDLNVSPLLVGLAKLQPMARGANSSPDRLRPTSMQVVLPAPGDALGLPGPPELNKLAIQAGQAIVAPWAPFALIPSISGDVTTWTAKAANADRVIAPAVRPEEADSAVRAALYEATTALSAFDLGENRSAIGASLNDLDQQLREFRLPRSLPPTQTRTAHTAARLLGVIRIVANRTRSPSTVSDHEDQARILDNLARTARHALAAACSAEQSVAARSQVS